MADTANWDPTGEAARQLEAAVEEYGGEGCLSDPEWLAAWFADVLPEAPRERDLLVTAAEFGVVRRMSVHVEANVDPETAVRLTASDLGAERAPSCPAGSA